jgi:iron complex outermembrane recepter protein
MNTIRTLRHHARRGFFALPFFLALCLSAHAQVTPKQSPCTQQEINANDPRCADQLQEIVVTGSRIARVDLDRLEPTTTVTSATFDQRGYLDVGQALSELPSFGVQPASSNNTQSSFGIAQSFVDLYSLGSQRTLVLVDGRRFISSNTASLNQSSGNSTVGGPGSQVDLNVIPTKLIDRVETISVGGAPIYGADAIAGTVNIILKKDYEGIDADIQSGVSGQGDAWNNRLRILAGQNFAGGQGNITGVAEFTKTDGLIGVERPSYAQDLGFLAPATPGPYKTVLTPANSVPQVSFGGVPLVDDVFLSPPIFGVPNTALGVTNAAGQLQQFSLGALVPYNVGTQTGNPIFNSGGDGLRLSQVSNLLSPTERINVDVLPNFKINDHMTLYGEGWFSETHATNLLAQPAYNANIFGLGGTANGNFVISINNPFLSPSDRILIQNALNNYAATLPLGGLIYGGVTGTNGAPSYPAWNNSQFYVARASVDLQSGEATATQVVARGVAGGKGDFVIADRNFNWDVNVSYGSSSNTAVQPSYVFQNAANALNATTNAAGQIVCAGTPVNAPTTTESSTCAPLNIFGNGSPSAAAKAYITHLATATSFNTQRDANATLGGDVMTLPGGIWKASVGYENRRESADFSPDNFYTQNLGQAQVTAIAGSYITNEVYGETVVPILGPQQDIPALRKLEFEGAARRVDNSIAGNATTYTYGLRWQPVEDASFRINKTKSIRAPSITELFLPSATSFQFANDPCDTNFINQGTAPATRAKNCAAAGIPAGFVSNVVNATAQGTTSGNTNLQSETAYSKTYGVILTPRWVPRLNITVDYIDIQLKEAISTLTLVDNLDACYDSSSYPNAAACSTFTRDPVTHQITNFHAGFVNAGLLEFTGIQAGLDYNFTLPASLGMMEVRAQYLDTQRLESQIGAASANSLAGLIGTSKARGNIDILYGYKNFSWDWQGIYIGRANFSNQNLPTTQNYWGVPAWWIVNSTIGLQVTPAFKVRLIVDNVANSGPPYPALAATGGNFANATSVYFSGILGRAFQLVADYKFK